ncbi:transmembrane and immunoglobulin domain-containing protein 1 [Megalops cyprinoides]|uniref:transmembrane and immunoglobulin domain-containing protein 1 n=1 Tax=Megalops cyprinoides TaxID=118141 RepID=UPI0018646007|nr:transmembrane and immunoglobulin domain-containing protein 1 [Megalops cyprinoides]
MSPTLTVLSLLLYFSPHLTAVRVVSSPQANSGLISTEVEGTVSLTCHSEGVESTEELMWYRDKGLVELKDGNRVSQSSLCLSPVSKGDDGVTFTCRLRRDTSANASVQLDVRFPPDLFGNHTVMVEEDSDMTLTCDIHANPQVTVSWQRDGVELDLGIGGYMLFQDSMEARLSISRVKRNNHQGKYSCVALSPQYGERTKSFQLIVNDKTMKFPLGPIIAGVVVVFCTTVLAIVARWQRITKCCK